MAITLDFESNNPSSNLGRTLILTNLENFPEIFIVINYFFLYHVKAPRQDPTIPIFIKIMNVIWM